MIFLALTDSSELKFQLARRMQIYHVFIAVVRISKCQITYKGFSSHVKLANPALNFGKATLKRMKIIMNRVYFYGERERQKFAYIVKTSKRRADQ